MCSDVTAAPVPPAPWRDALETACRSIGDDLRLVQGAGGNVSVKHDGLLWIKASGTRLADAGRREIFVPLDQPGVREAVLVTEALTPYVAPEALDSGLRPSIETALHALLPHPTVFHVHSSGSIGAGLSLSDDALAEALGDLGDVAVVPYAKPGIELARAVDAVLDDGGDGSRPLVLVLRNHGLVVGGESPQAVLELIRTVEERLLGAPAPTTGATSAPLLPAGTVSDVARTVLQRGALTPDSAVFLGPAPFGTDEHPTSCATLSADGGVEVPSDLGADETEIVVGIVDAARQVQDPALVRALDDARIAELVDWEAEKWRRSQSR